MPQVSVIIPNYNHAAYLQQRIESVLNQTYQDFEVIILDDCSTDDSKVIIDQYRSHPKVQHILYNEQNSGSTFEQWVKGLSYTKGKWVWIAESDDYSNLSFLDEMVRQIKLNSKCVLVYSRTINIDSHGNSLGINLWADGLDSSRWNESFRNSGSFELNNYFLYRNVIPNASAVVFRNNVHEEIKELKKGNWKYCGDWYFWGLISKRGDLVYISNLLNYHRIHDNTTRSNKSFIEEQRRTKEIIECITIFHQYANKTIKWFDKRFDWIFKIMIERIIITNNFIMDTYALSGSVIFTIRLILKARAPFILQIGKKFFKSF